MPHILSDLSQISLTIKMGFWKNLWDSVKPKDRNVNVNFKAQPPQGISIEEFKRYQQANEKEKERMEEKFAQMLARQQQENIDKIDRERKEAMSSASYQLNQRLVCGASVILIILTCFRLQ